MGVQRVTWRDLPRGKTPCPVKRECVYRENGVCDNPRISKGNSDAACFSMSNKKLLALLVPDSIFPLGVDIGE